jgi:hypothetical protein
MMGDLIQLTLVLVMAYLIIANAPQFATAVGAGGAVWVNAIRAFQGR